MTKLFSAILLAFSSAASFAHGLTDEGKSTGHQNSGEASSQSTAETIRRIEATLALPSGSRDLVRYTRYYTIQRAGKDTYINAVYVVTAEKGRVIIVEPDAMPAIDDGGCDVVNLRYALREKKIVNISCNGVG